MRKVVLSLIACGVSLVSGIIPARADITLSNLNSVAKVDPSSQNGMYYWAIQGQNQLQQQWFWYRIGNNAEQSINAIGAPVITPFSGSRGVSALYTSAGLFSIQVDYLLSGGAVVAPGQTGVSDISETITINNLSANPLDFHFFQYSDFNLGPGNDTVQLGQNLFGKYNEAVQSQGGFGLTETVTAPGANGGEVALAGATLGKLNNGIADTLNNVAGPLSGNVTWALEWDVLLNQTFIISKDKNLSAVIQPVPEPSTFALVGVGLAGLGYRAWRKRKSA